ncbi:MAG: hypothetical protein IT214_08955 [Chitinophagaceae bacterium]|jgi:hypothetical protein|nr:hypothetical protein [Chitinophagaceae bacterium]OQY92372.1 MAG: hypothetical protein B6D37_13845 [Sphingobacteriales bacterium UTBCD1]
MLKINLRCCLLLAAAIGGYGVSAQNNSKQKYSNTFTYSGIEVGAKGVKLSVVEIGKSTQPGGSFNILKDTSINTDFISFTQPTFDATLNAYYNLYTKATKDYQIKPQQVYTVISSGVKMQADKENKTDWIDRLIGDFKQKIKEPQRQVEVVSVTDEARLSHLGIIPEARRYNTFLIDIGSGNAKGGFFPYGNTKDFKLFQLNWGTKSVANTAEKRCENDNSLTNYNKQLYRVLSEAENNDIVYAVNESGAYPKSDNIAFSGGIAWATATLMYPELSSNSVVAVTFDKLIRYSEKLINDFSSFSDNALVKNITDRSVDKDAAAREIKRVHAVFDQKSLMAGTGLMLKIMRQFVSVFETKQFFLVKNGQVGWISAYVDKNTNK